MSGLRRIEVAVGAVIILLVAGLTHFVSILIMPKVSTHDAFSQLGGLARSGQVALLPQSRPGSSLLPFRDPSTLQGVCLFDLSKGPVRVRASTAGGGLFTLSFRAPDGRIFYSMTDRAASHDRIDIRLVTAAQLAEIDDNESEDQGLPEELRLKAPALTGLVVATALVDRPGRASDAEARIKAMTCAPEPLTPRS